MIKHKTIKFLLKKYLGVNNHYPVKKINKKKVIFIHVPKTGGTSISKLFGFTHWTHHNVKQIKNKVGSDWVESFKFAFVRNPYERALSLYQEFIKHKKKYKSNIEKELSFEKWLTYCFHDQNTDYIWWEPFFATQKKWLVNEKGILEIDHLARFEDMEEEIDFLSNYFGVTGKLQKLNQGFLKSKYASYRSIKTDQIIENYFCEDFEAFNYSFRKF